MPVAAGAGAESPENAVPGQAGPDMRIRRHIDGIVEGEEPVAQRRGVERGGEEGQSQTNPERTTHQIKG